MVAVISWIVTITSCADDENNGNSENNEELIKANAVGMAVDYFTHGVETLTMYLWIDDYSIYHISDEEYISKNQSISKFVYKPFAMDLIYANLSSDFGIPDITDETDFTSFEPNPRKYIEFMKTQRGKYDYICFIGSSTYLFNRTGNNIN